MTLFFPIHAHNERRAQLFPPNRKGKKEIWDSFTLVWPCSRFLLSQNNAQRAFSSVRAPMWVSCFSRIAPKQEIFFSLRRSRMPSVKINNKTLPVYSFVGRRRREGNRNINNLISVCESLKLLALRTPGARNFHSSEEKFDKRKRFIGKHMSVVNENGAKSRDKRMNDVRAVCINFMSSETCHTHFTFARVSGARENCTSFYRF